MNTHTELSAKTLRGKDWTRAMLLPAILALLPVFGALNAQPIDLCSYPNGIVLEIGGLDQITVEMSANSTLRVTIIEECDPERPVDSDGGVYLSGTDAPSPDFLWVTGANNTPSNAGTFYDWNITTDSQFTISLDACPGTRVLVECV